MSGNSRNYNETDTGAKNRIDWFFNDKFGLFIHWGLYAIPAGEWNGKEIPGIGEWIMYRAQIPVKEYEKLAEIFNPTKFDPDAWADMAYNAGMKYVVITAKHHDGFAMYHSRVSKYNVVDATPFKRDVLKELAEACRKRGLRFGVYYSQAQDWHEPDGAGNDWEFPPDNEKDFDGYLRNKALPQVEELLTNYGPICLVWFDTPKLMNEERAAPFINLIRRLQPECLIDGRLGMPGDYVSMGDNRIPPEIFEGAWETPATINDTWGYKKNDHNWKTPAELVFKLVDIVSKGGNYLLNVGPDDRGIIPEQSKQNLLSVGEWLKVNGEAIYGTQRTAFGYEFGKPTGEVDEQKKPLYSAGENWRCTVKPGKIFLHLFDWPYENKFIINTEGKINAINRIYLLADETKKQLDYELSENVLKISLPDEAQSRDPLCTVVCIE